MSETLTNIKDDFKSKNFVKITSAISFIFLCVYIFDCALTGAGRYLNFGPISIRMLLLGLTILLGLPMFFKSFKTVMKKPVIIWLIVFGCYLIISAVIGFKNHNQTNLLLGDIKGFMYLALLPVAVAIITSKDKVLFLMKCIVAAAFVLSLATFIINGLVAYDTNIANMLYRPLLDLKIGFVNTITSHIVRIFMKSLPYIIVGCAFSLYFILKSKKINWFYIATLVLGMWSVIFSYTRSAIGSAVIAVLTGVIIYIIISPKLIKPILKNAGIAILIFIISAGLLYVPTKSNYVRYALSRIFVTFQDSTQEQTGQNNYTPSEGQQYLDLTMQSDEYRAKTDEELKQLILKSPIIGNGLGARIELRENVENTHADMIAKMGIIGFLIYYAPFIAVGVILLAEIIKNKKRKQSDNDKNRILSAWFCGLLVFVVITYFNPYMNASLGISCYVLAMSVFSNRKQIFNEEYKTLSLSQEAKQE